MDSATAEILQGIGNDLLRGSAAIIVETFFLAIYTVLMYIASRILIHKGFKRVPVITLIILLTMYAMALAMWGFDVTNLVREIQTTLISNPEAPMADKYEVASHDIFSLVAPLDVMYSFMVSGA
ncbi:hypothetical protein C0993_009525 [Termitomyces sp. T159_Od127]|nr:hypothetical protein C0993_009525 [Termitomyces sp. T159_Od127]